MVMPAWPVYMAMVEFFLGGLSNTHDLHIEVKLCPGKRVIEVERHIIALDAGDHGNGVALSGIHLHLHAYFKLLTVSTLKTAQGNKVHQLVIILSIGIGRGHNGLHLVALGLAMQLGLQARDQVADALNVGQWFAALRAVQHFAFYRAQGVMNVHHAVILNRHFNDFLMVPTPECRNAGRKVQVLSLSDQDCCGQLLMRVAQAAPSQPMGR